MSEEINPGAKDIHGNYTEEDNPLWDHFICVSVRAPTYKESLRLMKEIEKGLVVTDFHTEPVSLVLDYEEDNYGQRVYYLHSIEDPDPPTGKEV